MEGAAEVRRDRESRGHVKAHGGEEMEAGTLAAESCAEVGACIRELPEEVGGAPGVACAGTKEGYVPVVAHRAPRQKI
jgi:hypothetical protein